MSSKPREPEGDELADELRVEPDWIERLRLAREQQTKVWGRAFVGGRPPRGAGRPVEAGPPDAPEHGRDAAGGSFFDQDADTSSPPSRPHAHDDPFYDQDEEPWT